MSDTLLHLWVLMSLLIMGGTSIITMAFEDIKLFIVYEIIIFLLCATISTL